jgi:OmpA family
MRNVEFEFAPFTWAPHAAAFEAELESGRGVKTTPTLTIRVRPFVVLDQFAHKVATMPPAHAPIIERIARLIVASRISRQPLTTVRLVGHADSTGDASFNVGIGTQRAQSVEARLRAAITALGAVPAGALNIVVQSQGEAKPVGNNATPAGRASNRRVEVFLDTTCHSFFAQYDLRFLPGDPVFGIPAHPNLANKAQRTADVGAIAGELQRRRNLRAAAALASRVPALGPASSALRAAAQRLSSAQLALFREYFEDGRGGIDFAAFRNCFERFANGQLRSPLKADQDKGIAEPNSDFYFLFAEFAFLCVASGIATATWMQALRVFVGTQEIFMHVYRPPPLRPAPAVGAPLPACPRAAGRPSARRLLSTFSNKNFRRIGASPLVGSGQSSPTRKRLLAARYASATLPTLKLRARENLLRAQCMP